LSRHLLGNQQARFKLHATCLKKGAALLGVIYHLRKSSYFPTGCHTLINDCQRGE